MTIATTEPISTSTFMKRAKGSTTKAPLKASPSPAGTDQPRAPATTSSDDRQPGHQAVDALAAERRRSSAAPARRRRATSSGRRGERLGEVGGHVAALCQFAAARPARPSSDARDSCRPAASTDAAVDVEDRRRIDAEEDGQHDQRNEDRLLARRQVEDGLQALLRPARRRSPGGRARARRRPTG